LAYNRIILKGGKVMRTKRKGRKAQIKAERDAIFLKMCQKDITKEEWDTLSKRYHTYNEMLKPTWRISPDVLFSGLISLGSIILVLNYEKLDIVRSKAFSLIPKRRV
jgi:hypothetical protein